MSTALKQVSATLQASLSGTVMGMQPLIDALMIALVGRGHVLVQGVPGLGKTLLSKCMAAAVGGSFRRIQGTADLMPSDITGVHIYESERRSFAFHPGPLFADVLLFDEINRAGPKTQSALLEAMEERQVSIDREIYALPADFLVIATQNPRDFEGTFPLPESQLDRFMLRLDLDYPQRVDELAVLERYGGVTAAGAAVAGEVSARASATATLAASQLAAARAGVDAIHLSPALSGYVLDLARATREHPQLTLGLSTRGALALLRAARIAAALRDAQFVTPDDVKRVWPWVTPHRLVLSSEAVLEGVREQRLAQQLLDQVPVPR